MSAIFVLSLLFQGYGPMLLAHGAPYCAPSGGYCTMDEQCCSRTCVPTPNGAFGKCY